MSSSPPSAAAVAGQLAADRIIAVVRIPEQDVLRRVAEVLHEGGIRFVELTLTCPGALTAIRAIATDKPDDVRLGVGSVRTADQARAAILEGAEFLVCPAFDPGVVDVARRFDRVVVPGAFTPTEIETADRAGATAVKVFPADLGGPGYIRAVLAPMPELRLVPTGGVNLDTVGPFLAAGSFAVAAGSALVDRRLVADRDWDGLRDRAARFRAAAAR